jgi:hypothetical protein
LLTSIPTHTSAPIAPPPHPDRTRPCTMRARRQATAPATVRASTGLQGRGDPCSPTASSDPGSIGLPRPRFIPGSHVVSEIQGSTLEIANAPRHRLPATTEPAPYLGAGAGPCTASCRNAYRLSI